MRRPKNPLTSLNRAELGRVMLMIARNRAIESERHLLDEYGRAPKTMAEFKHRALFRRLQELQRSPRGDGKSWLAGDRITAESFQRMQNVGTIDLSTVGGQGTPLQLQTPRPIVALHFFMTLTTTETSASGVQEDAMQGFWRTIRLTHGGEPIITLGDGSKGSSAAAMLEPVVRGWMQSVPHLTQVADGGNTALLHIMVPVSAPTNRYGIDEVDRSALRIGTDSTWFINTVAGQLLDLFSTVGDLAITLAEMEVVAEINDDLSLRAPSDSFMLMTNFENLSLATAGTRRRIILSADGTALFHAYQQRENSLRSRVILTNMELRVDGSHQVYDGSWNLYEWMAEFFGDAPGNIPVGLAAAILDNEFDLGGIPVAAATGWDALLNNSAGTGAASDGLNIQSFYVLPLAA